jgi:hypothetical protein
MPFEQHERGIHSVCSWAAGSDLRTYFISGLPSGRSLPPVPAAAAPVNR